jgi:hypothetical protein
VTKDQEKQFCHQIYTRLEDIPNDHYSIIQTNEWISLCCACPCKDAIPLEENIYQTSLNCEGTLEFISLTIERLFETITTKCSICGEGICFHNSPSERIASNV